MGAVWAATHQVTGKSVALKFLSDGGADVSARKRLLREARAACSVTHPHVVQVHDVFEIDDGVPVLVMDLLEGESLGDRVERERVIPPDELVRILIQMVSGLEAAHARGVVHRDIKPDNVFLVRRAGADAALDVKVLDFGIAKVTRLEDGESAETAKLTGTGAMMGTPYYMAPEQVFGEKDVDARTDLWAIGILIYECVAGARPTEGANLGQILKLVTVGPFKPLLEAAPHASPALARIVDACLERDRDKRIPTATALREALARFAAGTTFDGAEIAQMPPGASVDAAPSRVRRWSIRAALAAALLALAGGTATLARRTPSLALASPASSAAGPSPAPPSTFAKPSPAGPSVSAEPSPAPSSSSSSSSSDPSASPATSPPSRGRAATSATPSRPPAHRGPKAAASGDRGPGGVVLTPPPSF
jgi:serine/threonine-protein kinase